MARLGAMASTTRREDERTPASSIGALSRPSFNEDPPQTEQEFTERVERNAGFLQQPEIQAAMLQFAINIMQPVGGSGGAGDFAGALARSVGEGVQAAGRVQTNREEEGESARKKALEERKMQVDEGELSIREEELRAKRKTGLTRSIVIDGSSPLNSKFALGLKPGQSAKIQIQQDPDSGKVIGASVEGEFGSSGTDGTEITKLMREAREAEASGDMQTANLLKDRAFQLSQEFSLSTGEMLRRGGGETGAPSSKAPAGTEKVTDADLPTGAPRVVPIPGGKLEREAAAADVQAETQKASDMQKGFLVGNAVDQIGQIVDKAWAPGVNVTGGFGSLFAILPMETDARKLANHLEVLKSNVGFDQLQKMREASPTGGALGPVSDTENKLLQSTLVSLDQFSGKEQLMQNVLTIKWLFDPESVEQRQVLAKMVEDGDISEAHAKNQFDEWYQKAVFGMPDPPPPLNWDEPPDYLEDEDKELWHNFTSTQKYMFFNESDRNRAMGGDRV